MGKRSQGREIAILALFSQFVCESESSVWKDTLDFIQAELFPVPEIRQDVVYQTDPAETIDETDAGEDEEGTSLIPQRFSESEPLNESPLDPVETLPGSPDESVVEVSVLQDDELSDLKESLDFAAELCEAVSAKISVLDPRIQKHLQKWDLKRIGVMEKTILRLAAYELLETRKIAPEVVIAEAVKLSLEYCQDNSHKFINGVLASLLLEIRPEGSSATQVFDFGSYEEE